MLRYRAAGRDVKVTLRGTRREAEAELTRLLRERDAGNGRRVTSKETFAVYAARWLESRKHRVEPGTIEAYQKHLDIRLLPTFGHLKLRQVTRERVETYVRELDRAGTLSAKTINDSLVPLRQIMARALREGIVATNPAASVDRDEPLELPHEKPRSGRSAPPRPARISTLRPTGIAKWPKCSWEPACASVSSSRSSGATSPGTPAPSASRALTSEG